MARRSVSEESVGREPEGRHEVRRMTAADVVRAICGALNRDEQCRGEGLGRAPCDFVTAVVVPEGGEIDADPEELRSLGVEDVVRVGATRDARGRVVYNADDLVSAFRGIIARHLDMD